MDGERSPAAGGFVGPLWVRPVEIDAQAENRQTAEQKAPHTPIPQQNTPKTPLSQQRRKLVAIRLLQQQQLYSNHLQYLQRKQTSRQRREQRADRERQAGLKARENEEEKRRTRQLLRYQQRERETRARDKIAQLRGSGSAAASTGPMPAQPARNYHPRVEKPPAVPAQAEDERATSAAAVKEYYRHRSWRIEKKQTERWLGILRANEEDAAVFESYSLPAVGDIYQMLQRQEKLREDVERLAHGTAAAMPQRAKRSQSRKRQRSGGGDKKAAGEYKPAEV